MRLMLTTVGAVLALACPAPALGSVVHAHSEAALASAVAEAPAGTTVVVHEGFYSRVAFDRSGIALRAQPGAPVTLAGVSVNGAERVSVRGFRITGACRSAQAAPGWPSSATTSHARGFGSARRVA